MKLQLELPLAGFDALCAAFHGTRAGAVKVDRAALGRLLRDHSKALARLGDAVTDPFPPATLNREAA